MTPRRRTIYVDRLHHATIPVPNACVVDGMLVSGGISGVDVTDGSYPESLAREAELMFSNMARVLEAAGGPIDDVVKVTLWVRERATCASVDPAWASTLPIQRTGRLVPS